MISMIELFNEMEILRVEIDGNIKVNLISGNLSVSFGKFKLKYFMKRCCGLIKVDEGTLVG